MSEQGKEPKYPIGGFAPGNYTCICSTCGNRFIGDKRAVQCFNCAFELIGETAEQTSKDHSSPKEGEELEIRYAEDGTAYTVPKLSKKSKNVSDRYGFPQNVEPKEQVSNWKERFSEEYAICSGESSDLIKWIEENLINQKVPQVSNTDEEILKKLDFDESGSIELQCWDLTKLLEEARQDERNKLELQLREANDKKERVASLYKANRQWHQEKLKKAKQEISRLEDFIRHLENPKTRD